jgi:hypothetical protein
MTSARLSGSSASSSAHIKLIDDRRFRALLSDEDWGRLPLATWRRFSKRVADGDSIVYVGVIDEISFSETGWWVAQAARLIGGPLPTGRDTGVPMIVTVTEDGTTGGQTWTRICARKRGFPNVIHSAKRFAGPTGLEEYVGFGVSMALRTAVEDQTLIFRSAGYGLQLGRLWIPLPRWLTPGDLTVTHRDLGNGAFRFTLDVIHPRYGALIHQSATFREAIS